MKCRLVTLLTWTSMVLCIIPAALWVRSVFVADVFERIYGGDGPVLYADRSTIEISDGGILFSHRRIEGGDEVGAWKGAGVEFSHNSYGAFGYPHFFNKFHKDATDLELGVFEWTYIHDKYDRFEGLVLPLPVLLLLTLLLPYLRIRRWVQRKMEQRRLAAIHACRHCGYDLRATPDRCPECGTVPRGRSSEG